MRVKECNDDEDVGAAPGGPTRMRWELVTIVRQGAETRVYLIPAPLVRRSHPRTAHRNRIVGPQGSERSRGCDRSEQRCTEALHSPPGELGWGCTNRWGPATGNWQESGGIRGVSSKPWRKSDLSAIDTWRVTSEPGEVAAGVDVKVEGPRGIAHADSNVVQTAQAESGNQSICTM